MPRSKEAAGLLGFVSAVDFSGLQSLSLLFVLTMQLLEFCWWMTTFEFMPELFAKIVLAQQGGGARLVQTGSGSNRRNENESLRFGGCCSNVGLGLAAADVTVRMATLVKGSRDWQLARSSTARRSMDTCRFPFREPQSVFGRWNQHLSFRWASSNPFANLTKPDLLDAIGQISVMPYPHEAAWWHTGCNESSVARSNTHFFDLSGYISTKKN